MTLRRSLSMRLGELWGMPLVCPATGSRLIAHFGLNFREVLRFAHETGELADAEHCAAVDKQTSNNSRSLTSAHHG
jgi:hypothetical protein